MLMPSSSGLLHIFIVSLHYLDQSPLLYCRRCLKGKFGIKVERNVCIHLLVVK